MIGTAYHERHERNEKHETKPVQEIKIIFKEESYAIQGAVFEVYREMGCGFLEAVYQECLEKEFHTRGIPFLRQPELALSFKDQPLLQTYRPDFICFNQIIVELKSVSDLVDEHRAQVMNYLKSSRLRLGLLVNFGHHPKAQIERIVL